MQTVSKGKKKAPFLNPSLQWILAVEMGRWFQAFGSDQKPSQKCRAIRIQSRTLLVKMQKCGFYNNAAFTRWKLLFYRRWFIYEKTCFCPAQVPTLAQNLLNNCFCE